MSKKTLPNPYLTVRKPKRARTPENFPKMKHRARRRERVDHLGMAHISIIPVTDTFESQIKRAFGGFHQRVALGFDHVGHAATLAALAINAIAPKLPPTALPTAVLNPNVRKRR